MTESSDLERAIEASLRERAGQIRQSEVSTSAAFDRLDLRRRRRRTIAGVGSVAAIGVGVLGFVALGDGEGSDDLAAAGDLQAGRRTPR